MANPFSTFFFPFFLAELHTTVDGIYSHQREGAQLKPSQKTCQIMLKSFCFRVKGDDLKT
jgi:hypothetical protein